MISDSDSDSDFGFGEDDNIASTEEEETSPEEEDATRDETVEQDNDEEAVAEERIKKKRRRFSLQDKIRERWESWMFAEGIIHGTTSPPTRKHIAEWAIHANNTLTETVIKNSWRHGEYSWFLEENTTNNNST